MNIVCIVQARMGATRFPDKVISNIYGKPMIIRVLERLMFSKLIDTVVVATSISNKDDIIEKVCKENHYSVFRGSEDDVLDRYFQTAEAYEADIIVRVTGDCPLIDPNISDKVIQYYIKSNFDYVSNTLHPTYPDGLDTQVFSYRVLGKANKEAKLPIEREHVIPYIKNHPEIFSLGEVRHRRDLSYMRWTVDYEKDLEFVRQVYANLMHISGKLFTMGDVLRLLKQKPELARINSGIERDESYFKQLRNY